MPKVTLTPQKRLEARIVRNIRILGDYNGCRYTKDIAKRAFMSVSTLCAKMNNPWKFTLADLAQIAAAFKIDPKELLAEMPACLTAERSNNGE